jgi:elongation factor G
MNRSAGLTLLTIVVEPNTPDDRQRLTDAMQRLTAEDPRCGMRAGPVVRQVLIGGFSEEHLERILDRLRREFNVKAAVGRPEIAYREALTQPADGEMKYARQTSGAGEYGHVKIRLHPREVGAGYLFENRVLGGAVPAQFIQAVDEGIQDALDHGGIAGYPIHDVRAELHDGSYHDVDSSEAAFRAAASLATAAAVRKGEPVVLEPVMRVETVVPAACATDVVENLVSRRGRVQSRHDSGDMHAVRALVPLAGLFGYGSDFRSRTVGRGTWSMQFEAFVPVPAPDDGDPDSAVGVPRSPAPSPRNSGVALPEPDNDDVEE